MTLGAKKFDRYALPAIVVLDLLAGIGLWCAARRLAAARPLLPLLALQAAILVRAYPHPLAAYNPLLGGAAGARQAILVGWGEGLEQVAAYLDRQPRADRLVATTTYWNVLRPLFRGTTAQPDEPAPLDYYVVYINMAQRDLVHPAVRRAIASRPPEFTAVVHGVEYAWVYRVSGAVAGPCAAAPACSESDD
jgi:hypothetical protein